MSLQTVRDVHSCALMAHAAPPRHARVFLAEDDPSSRDLLRDALAAHGYEVVAAPDGETALLALASAADGLEPVPDAVLLDVVMPGYSGLGILNVMRRFESRPPTFVLTAFTDPSVESLARRLGARRVLHKPIDLDGVLAEIDGALKRPPPGSS